MAEAAESAKLETKEGSSARAETTKPTPAEGRQPSQPSASETLARPAESPAPTASAPATSAPTTSAPTSTPTGSGPAADVSLPPMDTALPPIDMTLPPLDTSLPAMDSNIPALPIIDTTLPPIGTALPSTDINLPPHDHPPSTTERRPSHTGANGASLPSNRPELPTSTASNQAGSTPAQAGPHISQFQAVNGSHQYTQQPHNTTQPPPPPQQQQQQQHYQPQNQQPQESQNPGAYRHNQPGNTPMSASQPSSTSAPTGHVPQAPIGSPLPSAMPPMASGGQFLQGYATNMSQMGMTPHAQMRYQMQGDPSALSAAARHKKEVKRRTKTGCLTCRKRRIKCDEGHPVCRNCVKSKRECLGYDPVFKPPAATTPSAIQPAPNSAPSLVVNPQEPTAATAPSYPSAPPGYMPAASQPFTPSLHSESPPTSTEQFDHRSSVDRSLNGHNTTITSPNNNNNIHNNNNNGTTTAAAATATSQFNAPATMTSVQSLPDRDLQNGPAAAALGPEAASFKVKQVRIKDLLALRGIPPPSPHSITTLPPNRVEEIQAVFLATYAPAIDRFFETRWFQEKALTHLMANAQLMAEYSALIDAFNDRNLSDPNVVARLESFEASVVWTSMTICRQVLKAVDASEEPAFDLVAASARLDVIEALITGEYLELNPLSQYPVRQPAANPPTLPDQLLQRSLDFWTAIGHFLTLRDDEASSAKEIDDTLGRARTLLDTYENRDVIYSIAIARHLGQRWADFPRSFPQPITTNEKDAGAKLYVAQKFLEQEASGRGTTQVIKRICGMVLRSWIVSRE